MNNKFYIAKNFISFMFVALVAAFQSAKADNKMYIEDFSVIPGNEVTANVILENTDPVSSLEFDFTLPKGLHFKNYDLSSIIFSLVFSSFTTPPLSISFFCASN